MQKLNGTLYIDADFDDAVGRFGARNLLMKPTLHLKRIHFRISFKGLKRLTFVYLFIFIHGDNLVFWVPIFGFATL